MRPFELPSERVAGERLQRRRTEETERRKRVFNDKVRTIGVDQKALDLQIKEKKEKEEATKRSENDLNVSMLENSDAACILHSRRAEERKGMEKAVATYRLQHQQPWQRREFDLNDPDSRKKMEPCDAQMILPGLVGEDLEVKDRQQRQREQLKDWLLQQQQEQNAARKQQQLEEQRYNRRRAEMDDVAEELQRFELETRKAAAVETKNYNLSQIEEKQRWKELTADGVIMGWSGESGLFTSSERGPPAESPLEIAQYQKQQTAETRRSEEQKKMEEEQLDGLRLSSARSALLLERQQARTKQQLRRHMDRTNAQRAQTLRQQKADIERGNIDDSFFSQFNTCSR